MRIIHTADWHLGFQQGYVDRTPDQFRCIDALIDHCEREKADVLVVAGDVFHDYQGEHLARNVRSLAPRLLPLLERGMHVVFIPGNHDKEYLFLLLETVQQLEIARKNGRKSADDVVGSRLRFFSRPSILTIPDPSGDYGVQFVLAPYPTPEKYLPDTEEIRGLGAAERRAHIARAYAAKVGSARSAVTESAPAVLVSHAYVRGTETSTLFRMNEEQDVPIEPGEISLWSYVALGHIHKAQAIGERTTVRYSGSPDRLDLGEKDDDKSCVLVEIDGKGNCSETALLPLPATPVYQVRVDDPAELPSLAATYPNHEEAVVHLSLTWRPGIDNRSAIEDDLKRIFPRFYRLDSVPVGDGLVVGGFEVDPLDMAATVKAFLEEQLRERSEEDRARILALAADLVAEVGNASRSN